MKIPAVRAWDSVRLDGTKQTVQHKLKVNTWKLQTLNVISLFQSSHPPYTAMKVISRLAVEGVITPEADKWRDYVEGVCTTTTRKHHTLER